MSVSGLPSARSGSHLHGASGQGPVHLLLVSTAGIGSAWGGGRLGWIRAARPPLWMLAGAIQHFLSAIFERRYAKGCCEGKL